MFNLPDINFVLIFIVVAHRNYQSLISEKGAFFLRKGLDLVNRKLKPYHIPRWHWLELIVHET